MNESQAVAAFGALAQDTRLRMLRFLVQQGAIGANAGKIAETAQASPSRSSFHLSALAAAGLVTATRQSRQIIYHADFSNLGALAEYLVRDCCGGHPQIVECCDANATAKKA